MDPLWQPGRARIAHSRLTAFTAAFAQRLGRELSDYASLHRQSIAEPGQFWPALWDFFGIIGDPGEPVVADLDRMPGARFFPDGRLNFAENLLRRSDDATAIYSRTERGPARALSFKELRSSVLRTASAMRASGIGPGDRVAGIVSNVPEAIVAALGGAAIGAAWSSCSPDFGVRAMLDRFGQIEPRLLISVAGYGYGGKHFDCLGRLSDLAKELPTLRQIVVIPDLEESPDLMGIPNASVWAEWLDLAPATGAEFERFPFNHPLYILYSSGTTGVPKCIVHGAGGTLIQHLKEHQLHCDITRDDRVFYFTTTGWMMWNWLVTVLASEAALVLYDGSPFFPDGRRLFDLAAETRMTLFGTSAKFIDAVNKAGLRPVETHDLSSVRTITSTGSPLAPESFDFVYRAIKADVHLASISGGTDIVGLFAGGNPNLPVWRGEIQVPCLGMDLDVFDAEGHSLRNEAGELVCKSPFPSMPIGFWNDPDGAKYRASYFERYPGIWWHGDWCRFTEHGGVVIYGRSDATLKPGGVRIGTAEIYRQVEQVDEVVESLAVGQQWQGDERIVLFVRLRDGVMLTPALREKIAVRIRANASPRHVPARIVQVADLPRTRSGKLAEMAVRSVIHDRPVPNRDALANPDTLELFRGLAELET
jgi:acetoacetyl-CoA synthetase